MFSGFDIFVLSHSGRWSPLFILLRCFDIFFHLFGSLRMFVKADFQGSLRYTFTNLAAWAWHLINLIALDGLLRPRFFVCENLPESGPTMQDTWKGWVFQAFWNNVNVWAYYFWIRFVLSTIHRQIPLIIGEHTYT